MRPTEEATSPADVAAADVLARASLVRAAALLALSASGCSSCAPLFASHLEQTLVAIAPGAGSPLRVAVVDGKGNVRQGRTGAMTADEAVAEMRAVHPEWERFGWPK
jgi:hypothetical protein